MDRVQGGLVLAPSREEPARIQFFGIGGVLLFTSLELGGLILHQIPWNDSLAWISSEPQSP